MIAEYKSPCGVLRLGVESGRLVLCDWTGDAKRERSSLQKSGATDSVDDARTLSEVIRQLDLYFSGGLKRFDIPLEMHGTEFQLKVWRALLDIPYGATVTYSEVARMIGSPSSTRAVAGAIGANLISLFIPCHRVVGANGKLTGYAGGLAAKKALLELESRVSLQDV